MKLQERKLEQKNRINCPTPLIRRIAVGDQRSQQSEIKRGIEPPQIMIRWHECLKDQLIEWRQLDIVVTFEHPALSRWIGDLVSLQREPARRKLFKRSPPRQL